MPEHIEDALAKATEAVTEFLLQDFCRSCPLPRQSCNTWCNVMLLRNRADLLARAVLEAVKYDKLEAVVEALRDFYDNCQCLECAPKRGEEQCEQDPCWGDNLIDALAVLEQAEGVKTDALPTS